MWDVLQYSDAHGCISILVWNIKINAILFFKKSTYVFFLKKGNYCLKCLIRWRKTKGNCLNQIVTAENKNEMVNECVVKKNARERGTIIKKRNETVCFLVWFRGSWWPCSSASSTRRYATHWGITGPGGEPPVAGWNIPRTTAAEVIGVARR